MGWSLRTVGQLAAIGPSGDSVTSDYAALLANNMTYWNAQRLLPGQNPLGILYSYELAQPAYGPGETAVWQQNFITQTFGHLSDIEALADLTALNLVRDYYYRWPVGLLGADGATGYCYSQASSYTIKVANGPTSDITTCFDSWAAVYQASSTFGATCGTALLGDGAGEPGVASSGYWGNLLPAIAFAKDHLAPGADAAWTLVTGATNFSTLANSSTPSFDSQPHTFHDLPNWGIVPRGFDGT